MGVRVRVRLRSEGREELSSALVNTGYEGVRPEVHVPLALARRLGYSLEGARSERYAVVGGEVTAFRLGQVRVSLDVEPPRGEVLAEAVCALGEYEVIINDALAEELGIEVLAPRRGLWRVRGDERIRESSEPMFWTE
jgi:hypothetical protein